MALNSERLKLLIILLSCCVQSYGFDNNLSKKGDLLLLLFQIEALFLSFQFLIKRGLN